MKSKALMVLGTSSGVGKSFLAAGLCRVFSRQGFQVCPFKAQNMSNNSDVTENGGEMGRAQVVQAECARVTPHTDMNPILLKPAADNCSQVVIHGQSVGHFSAQDFYAQKNRFWNAIQESYARLQNQYELMVIEGAGSPAEINLKQNDLVNMRVAEMADANCLLVADIDRGGVFASIIGTLELLEPSERERILGIVINKFRGDKSLLEDGISFLEKRTGKKVLGVLPYDRSLFLEEEDAVSVEAPLESTYNSATDLDIAVILLPHMSNFTDFEIFKHDPHVRLRYVKNVKELGNPDLLILPGTKSTISDYLYLIERGFHKTILNFAENKGCILGVCGGFQMLGKWILDVNAVESSISKTRGLGLFNLTTEFQSQKTLKRVSEIISTSLFGFQVTGEIKGYEIHMGKSVSHQSYLPFGKQGIVSESGKIIGTYYHGLFSQATFRNSFLRALAKAAGKEPQLFDSQLNFDDFKEQKYNQLADFLEEYLDIDEIKKWISLSEEPVR